MTRITNADQVLLLLRNHLERAQKQRRKGAKPSASEREKARATPLQRVERLAAADGLPEVEIRKALIAGLLADEFGEAVANEAHFHQLVDDVLAIIEHDAHAGALLAAARRQLSSQ